MTQGGLLKRCARGHIMKPYWSGCEICGGSTDRTPRAMDTNPADPGPTVMGSASPTMPLQGRSAYALVGVLVIPELEQVHKLRVGNNTLGAAETNDIVLRGRFVSARHAILTYSRENGFELTDQDSTNGTLVNDKPVKQQILRDGDRIRMGNIQAVLKSIV